MSADILREAAALMRERAQVGGPLDYPPPWRVQKCDPETYGLASIVVCHEDGSGDVTDALDDSMAEYIASWHPAVALAVADWLDDAADAFADDKRSYEDERSRGKYPYWSPRVSEPALAVASAYLGRTS